LLESIFQKQFSLFLAADLQRACTQRQKAKEVVGINQ